MDDPPGNTVFIERRTRIPIDLPHVPLSDLPASSECIICHERFTASSSSERAVRLPCNHVVGCDCIREWFSKGNGSCPICRHQCIDIPERPPLIRAQSRAIGNVRYARMVSGRPSSDQIGSNEEDTDSNSEDTESGNEDIDLGSAHVEPDSEARVPPWRRGWRRGAISGAHRDYYLTGALTYDPTATRSTTSRPTPRNSGEASRSARTIISPGDEQPRVRVARLLPPPDSQMPNSRGLPRPQWLSPHTLRENGEAAETLVDGRSQPRHRRPSLVSATRLELIPTRAATIRDNYTHPSRSIVESRLGNSRVTTQRESHVTNSPVATSNPRQPRQPIFSNSSESHTESAQPTMPTRRSNPQPPPRMQATQYQPPPPPRDPEPSPAGRETRSGAYLTPREPTPLHIIASQAHSVLRQVLTTLPDRERELYHRLQQSSPRMPVLEDPERDLEYDEVRPLGGREPFLGIDPIGAALEGYNETTCETRHEHAFFDELQRIGAFSEPLGTRARLNPDRAIANRRTWVRYRQAGKVYHPGGGGRPTGWYTA